MFLLTFIYNVTVVRKMSHLFVLSFRVANRHVLLLAKREEESGGARDPT